VRDFDFRREDESGGEDVYSKVVRAGKRTYFFDVKATRGGDWFITVTESRKRTNRDGSASFEKNKIFLYKEDFAKFADGFEDAVGYVKEHKPEFFDEEARAAEEGAAYAADKGTSYVADRGSASDGRRPNPRNDSPVAVGADIDAEFDRL
jgi:hypothetical protein